MLRSDGYQTGVTSNLAAFTGRSVTPDVVVLSLGTDFGEAGQLIGYAQDIGCPIVAVIPAAYRDSVDFYQRIGVQTTLACPVCSSDLSGAIERAVGAPETDAFIAQEQSA